MKRQVSFYSFLGGKKMNVIINGKEFSFVFGYGFLKAINDETKIEASGITLNMGIANVVSSIKTGDVEGLIDVLQKANKTETPKLTSQDIEHLFDEHDAADLFDLVLEELKKSQFTKTATQRILVEMQNNQTKHTQEQ